MRGATPPGQCAPGPRYAAGEVGACFQILGTAPSCRVPVRRGDVGVEALVPGPARFHHLLTGLEVCGARGALGGDRKGDSEAYRWEHHLMPPRRVAVQRTSDKPAAARHRCNDSSIFAFFQASSIPIDASALLLNNMRRAEHAEEAHSTICVGVRQFRNGRLSFCLCDSSSAVGELIWSAPP